MKIKNIYLGSSMLAASKVAMMVVPFGQIVSPVLVAGGIINVAYGIFKEDRKDVDKINKVFKDVNFCNTEKQYAFVKYVKKYESYNLYRIVVPEGCSFLMLYKLIPNFINIFKNEVEIYEADYDYFVKVFTKKLKRCEDYPFEVIEIKDKQKLTLVLGYSLDGIFKLKLSDSLPNVMIGATTRAGKSRLVKAICLNIMENYTPEQVQMIYCDQKNGVEAEAFVDCEHFITTTSSVSESAQVFDYLEIELNRRLGLFKQNHVTNIMDYNKKGRGKLPFILIVIDELYPFLMLKNKKEVYNTMADLLSRSASAGFHFILATQKPTADVIPTFITENVGYRIGLRTANEQGSINVIGDKGCENIPVNAKGRGICFVDEKIHFQSFFVDDETIESFCKKHARKNITDKEVENKDTKEREVVKTDEVTKEDEVVKQIYDLNGGK